MQKAAASGLLAGVLVALINLALCAPEVTGVILSAGLAYFAADALHNIRKSTTE